MRCSTGLPLRWTSPVSAMAAGARAVVARSVGRRRRRMVIQRTLRGKGCASEPSVAERPVRDGLAAADREVPLRTAADVERVVARAAIHDAAAEMRFDPVFPGAGRDEVPAVGGVDVTAPGPAVEPVVLRRRLPGRLVV